MTNHMNRFTKSNPLKRTSCSDEIEEEIIQVLKSLRFTYRRRWGQGRRTREIKNRLGPIGNQRKGWSVWAKQCNYKENGEWLFDMTWLHYAGDILLSVPLVLESEWKRKFGDLMDDFQKMLLARADLRVMIFGAQTEKKGREITEEFIEQVEAFHRTEQNDRYLFAFWCDEMSKFICQPYVVKKRVAATDGQYR